MQNIKYDSFIKIVVKNLKCPKFSKITDKSHKFKRANKNLINNDNDEDRNMKPLERFWRLTTLGEKECACLKGASCVRKMMNRLTIFFYIVRLLGSYGKGS